jgi:polysaccharide biosynthesis/export protein
MTFCHIRIKQEMILLGLVVLFLSSCVTQKQVRYLQAASKTDTTSVFRNQKPLDYRVQPGDNLYISISSLSEKANEVFNQRNNSNYGTTGNASLYLDSYSVNKAGLITFPVLGQLYVKDLTIENIKDSLQNRINQYLKETIVIVKLVNFNVTVLGEVNSPGQYQIYQDAITIFDGISLAGDMTDFANRSKVALVRQTETGSKVYYIDLNSAGILSSPYYFLKPNDMIYVAPLKVKTYGFATFPYALVFSSISLILSLLIFFNTL